MLLFALLSSCIEPFQLEVLNETSAIVIDARLTNEMKAHFVDVSYSNSIDSEFQDSFSLDSVIASGVTDAIVWYEDQNGMRISLMEQFAGRYATAASFIPEDGVSYTLHVDLPDGNSYISDEETLPPESSIDNIYPMLVTIPSSEDQTNNRGIQILVDGHDLGENTAWYRYEWEDAYEFRAPFNNAWQAPDVPRTQTVHICYTEEKSNETILETTQGLTESKITEVPIRFLDQDEVFPIREYAINVRQYSIPSNAYRYYKDLKENNEGSGSFFDKQKGAVLGNIRAVTNKSEVVLGYFEIANVQEKEVSFTKDDFSNKFNPKYPCGIPLAVDTLRFTTGDREEGIVWANVERVYALLDQLEDGGWLAIPRVCADCTGLGDLEKPDLLKEQ